MSTLEVLRAAREYISDPARWFQGFYCLGDRYCAVGAINIANCREPDDDRISDAETALHRALPDPRTSIPDFNDSHSHAEVLALFDRAIAIEEANAAEFTAASEPAPLVAA